MEQKKEEIKDKIDEISEKADTEKGFVRENIKVEEKVSEKKIRNSTSTTRAQYKDCSKCKKPLIIIIIGVIIVLVAITAVVLFFVLRKKPKKESNPDIIASTNDVDVEIEIVTPKIKNEFEILTKAGDLKQISVIQKSKEETKINDKNITTQITRKTNYDVYFISQDKATEEYQDYYSKMTSGVITIRSECTSTGNEDCNPQPLIELTKISNNDKNNIRILEDLKDIPVPLCLFNITDNHIITTLTCPDSLSDIKRNEIILDLYFFRPPAAERADKENDNITLTIEKDTSSGQTHIHETNGGFCNIYNNWGSQCTTDMKTILDNQGNLLSYDEEAITIINYDTQNSYVKDKITKLVDSSENVKESDIKNYEKALKDLLPLINPYMKEEIQFTQSDFKDLLNVIEDKKQPKESQNYSPKKTKNTFRNLVSSKAQYIKKSSLFSNKETPIEVNLDLKINSGINSPVTGVYGGILFDDQEIQFSSIEEMSMIENLIDKLSSISKAGNQLASELYDKVYDKLEEATNEIAIKIDSLEKLIKYYEILPVFNNTLVKYSYNVLPSEIIQISNELLNKLSGIFFNLKAGNIKENADILYSNINNYVDKLHELIRQMLNSLGTLTNILTTKNNTFTQITNYYLNNTSSSYVNIIQKMKHILANYYIKEFHMVYPKIKEIIDLFEQNTNETLKDEYFAFKDLCGKLEKKIYTITSTTQSQHQNVVSNLENSDQYYLSIIQGIKDYLTEIMNIKPNGYFISDEDIKSFGELFTNILNEADEVARKLNNVDIIDKVFDDIMIKFRENYIFAIKFMDEIKQGNFTLEEDVLNTTSFSRNIKNQLDNEIKKLCDDILNKIKKENNDYISRIKNYFDLFLDDNLNVLNDIISDLNILFSEEGLQAIADSFESSLNLFSEKITTINNNNTRLTKDYFDAYYNLINNNNAIKNILKNYYLNYTYVYHPYYTETYTFQLPGDDIVIGKMRTSSYLTKYNIFMASLNYSEEYLKQQLYYDIMNEYRETFVQIKEELQSILNHNLSIEFPDLENLQFLEKHKRIIDKLKTRLDKYFSLDIFDNKYLRMINESINTNINLIKSTKEYIKEKHNSFNDSKYYDDESNDICVLFKRKVCYGCTNCIESTYFLDRFCFLLNPYHYNYLEVQKASYESLKNFGDFDQRLNNFNTKINDKVDAYNEIVESFNINMTLIQEETLNEKITENYLKPLQDWIKLTINQKLENNLLQSAYDYYQKNIENKIEIMFTDIYNRWKNTFEYLYQDVQKNLNNLKYSMLEFSTITLSMKTIIQTDLTKNYYNSIIEFQKSELNYTISYYYNYFYKLINKSFKYLIQNIPKNDNDFNEILITRNEEIKNYFNNIIKNLSNSEIYYLSHDNQLNILNIDETDFFKVNTILRKNINETDETLDDLMDHIAVYEMYARPGDDNTVVMRYYLENKEFGKLIEEFYKPLDNGEFFYLKLDKFKDVLFDNWIFDSDDFINILTNALYETNKEIKKELLIKLEEYETLIENEINKFFYDNIENVINDLYNKVYNGTNKNLNNSINNNVNNLLNRLETTIKSDSDKIRTNPGVYSFDIEKIKNYLNTFRNIFINQLSNSIFGSLNYLHQSIRETVYTNCIENNLGIFLNKAKDITDLNDFTEYNLLNSSHKIGEIIYNLTQEIIENYKTIVIKKIDSKYQDFYVNIKETINLDQIINDINTFFDNAYQNMLLPYMTTENNCTSGNCLNFEISNEIQNLLNNMNPQKIESIQGNNNLAYFQCNLDFTNSGINVIKPICKSLKNFLSFEKEEQALKINEFIQNFIKSNLDNFLETTVPLFGNQFFERIIDYNINFKVLFLYENLHYALGYTLLYYHAINYLTDSENLPSNLTIRLYQLNDLDITILNNEQELKILLEQKLNELINGLQDSVKEAYTYFLKENSDIINSFSSSVLENIDFNLGEVLPSIEKNYKNVLNKFMKEKFMDAFSDIFNEHSQKMIEEFYDERKHLKETLDPLFSSKEDKDLNAVNQYINSTLETIQTYRNFFYTFKISESAKDFFINYGNNYLLIIFKQFNTDLSKKLKEVIITAINNNSLEIEKLDPNEFINRRNDIYNNIYNNYIKYISDNFKEYGLNREDYKKNLIKIKEQNENSRRRRLVDYNDEEEMAKETKKSVESRYVEDTLELIDIRVRNTYRYIYHLNALSRYEKNIKNYNNTLNIDYKRIKDMINQNKYNEEIDTFMKGKLNNLTNILSDYYNKVYSSFSSLEKTLNSNFNSFIMNMYDVTVSTFFELNNLYINVSKSTNNISKIITNYIEEYPSEIDYNLKSENMMNNATVKINNLKEYGEFKFNLTLEGRAFLVPKIKYEMVNKIIPQDVELRIESGYGFCNKKGNLFNIELNDANLTMTVEYDTKSNYVNITTYNNIEKYNYTMNSYEVFGKEVTKEIVVLNYRMNLTRCISEQPRETSRNNFVVNAKNEMETIIINK